MHIWLVHVTFQNRPISFVANIEVLTAFYLAKYLPQYPLFEV